MLSSIDLLFILINMKMSSYIRVNTIKAQQVKISNNKDNTSSCNYTIMNCNVDKSMLIRKNEILREFGKDISNVSGKITSVNGSIREQIVKNRKTSDIIHKIKNNSRDFLLFCSLYMILLLCIVFIGENSLLVHLFFSFLEFSLVPDFYLFFMIFSSIVFSPLFKKGPGIFFRNLGPGIFLI